MKKLTLTLFLLTIVVSIGCSGINENKVIPIMVIGEVVDVGKMLNNKVVICTIRQEERVEPIAFLDFRKFVIKKNHTYMFTYIRADFDELVEGLKVNLLMFVTEIK